MGEQTFSLAIISFILMMIGDSFKRLDLEGTNDFAAALFYQH